MFENMGRRIMIRKKNKKDGKGIHWKDGEEIKG
jgi:hypothetical protein